MKKQMLSLALLALALSGCQSLPQGETASTGQSPYVAIGTEPFWSLKIESAQMRFERAGFREVRSGQFEARPSFNGWRYTSAKITADVTFVECSDGMSDNVYKDRVTVVVNGTEYRGCGGGVIRKN